MASAAALVRPSPPRSSNPRSTRSSAIGLVKKQQMRWTPCGAHLLLQIRTRVLNNTLTNDYKRWYPSFTHTNGQDQLAA
jgi:hypothetical protein